MKAMTAAPERVLVGRNNYNCESEKSRLENDLKIITDVLANYEAQEIEVSEKEIQALINASFSENSINTIAANRYAQTPKRQRTKLIEECVEDLMTFTEVFMPGYVNFSPAIKVKNGKAFIADGAFEEIEERHSYYISDEKSKELFARHQRLLDELNEFKTDLNTHTGGNLNTAQIVIFDATGDAKRSTIGYGK